LKDRPEDRGSEPDKDMTWRQTGRQLLTIDKEWVGQVPLGKRQFR